MKMILVLMLMVTTFSNASLIDDVVKFLIDSLPDIKIVTRTEMNDKKKKEALAKAKKEKEKAHKSKQKSAILRVLKKYKHSKGYRNQIADAIITVARETHISPSILLASTINESGANPHAKHPVVHVNVYNGRHKRRVRTRATGMNGVIYVIHKKNLRKIGIKSRKALLKPLNSLRAMASILKRYRNMKRIRGSKTSIQSGLMRYFGVPKTAKGRRRAMHYANTLLRKARSYHIPN